MSETASAAKPSETKSSENKSAEAKTAPDKVKLPDAVAMHEAARKGLPGDADGERNEVFTSLVTGDTDIVGLVAYSIYKQNKHDWLVAFNKHKSREPYEDELLAYIIGESTPRRLSTYRHLAEATLDGRGPKINVGPATEKFVQRNLVNSQAKQSGGKSNAMAWIIAAIVAIAAILAAGKFGIPGLR